MKIIHLCIISCHQHQVFLQHFLIKKNYVIIFPGGSRFYPQHRITHHLFHRCIKRTSGALSKMERQYYTTNRPCIQHIFYGVLFYTSKSIAIFLN